MLEPMTNHRPAPRPLVRLLTGRLLTLRLLTGLLLATHGAADAAATIYRCDPPDGGPAVFSQFPCGGDSEAVALEPVQTFAAPPLGEAEQRWLEGLARERREQATRRARAAEREAEAQRRQDVKEQQLCQAARDGLLALARQRRKGYTLAEAPDLERRESELLALRLEHC